MFAIGVWIYARATTARDRDRHVGVRRRDGISVRRISRQRQRHAAAVGHGAVGDGARCSVALTLWLAWWADRHRSSSVAGSRDLARTTGRQMATATPSTLRARQSGKTSSTSSTRRRPCSAAGKTAASSFRSLVVTIVLRRALLSQQRRAAADVRRRVRSEMAVAMRAEPEHSARGGRAHARASPRVMQMVVMFIFMPVAIVRHRRRDLARRQAR